MESRTEQLDRIKARLKKTTRNNNNNNPAQVPNDGNGEVVEGEERVPEGVDNEGNADIREQAPIMPPIRQQLRGPVFPPMNGVPLQNRLGMRPEMEDMRMGLFNRRDWAALDNNRVADQMDEEELLNVTEDAPICSIVVWQYKKGLLSLLSHIKKSVILIASSNNKLYLVDHITIQEGRVL